MSGFNTPTSFSILYIFLTTELRERRLQVFYRETMAQLMPSILHIASILC